MCDAGVTSEYSVAEGGIVDLTYNKSNLNAIEWALIVIKKVSLSLCYSSRLSLKNSWW